MGYAGGVDNIVTIVIWVYLVAILALFIGFYWKASIAKYNPSLKHEDDENVHTLSAKGFWTRRYLAIMLIIMACIAFLIIVYLSRKYILKRVRQAGQEGRMLGASAMEEAELRGIQSKREPAGGMVDDAIPESSRSTLTSWSGGASASSGSDDIPLSIHLGSSSGCDIQSDELFSGQTSESSGLSPFSTGSELDSLSTMASVSDPSLAMNELESLESVQSSPWGEGGGDSLYSLSSMSSGSAEPPAPDTMTNLSVPTDSSLAPASIPSEDVKSFVSWKTEDLLSNSALNDSSSESFSAGGASAPPARSASLSLDSRSSHSGSSGSLGSLGSLGSFASSNTNGSLASRSSSLRSLEGQSSSVSSLSGSLPEVSSASSSMGSLSSAGDSLFTSSMNGTLDSLDSMSSLSSADLSQFPTPHGTTN